MYRCGLYSIVSCYFIRLRANGSSLPRQVTTAAQWHARLGACKRFPLSLPSGFSFKLQGFRSSWSTAAFMRSERALDLAGNNECCSRSNHHLDELELRLAGAIHQGRGELQPPRNARCAHVRRSTFEPPQSAPCILPLLQYLSKTSAVHSAFSYASFEPSSMTTLRFLAQSRGRSLEVSSWAGYPTCVCG